MKNLSRLLCLMLSGVLLSGCVLVYSNFDFSNELKPLEEKTLAGEGSDRILLVDISGEIVEMEQSSFLGLSVTESVTSLLREQLKLAENNKKVKAVLLRIDSPGGSVTASDIIYQQLKAFREETRVPIYAVMMDVAASGGYYIAMAADKIYAHPTTITGSIGVIMLNLSFEGLMKKIGVSSKVIKSGENKDIGSPLKDLTPEEKAILQGAIDDLYSRFVDVVVAGRPKITRERVLKLADGRIYTATQAKDAGLIDEIAYLPEVVEQIKSDLKLAKARVVALKRPDRNMSNIYGSIQGPLPKNLSLIDENLTKPLRLGGKGPGFYYLWQPGMF